MSFCLISPKANMAKKEKISTSSQDNSQDVLKEARLPEGDDDVFETSDKSTDSQKDGGLSKDICDFINNSHGFNSNGSSSKSFPSMSMDFTFVPPPMDVTPRLPPPTNKTKAKQVSKRGNLGSTSEAATLTFVVDTWKSEGKSRRNLRHRRKMDILEENDARFKSSTLGPSVSTRFVVNKWRSLTNKKC